MTADHTVPTLDDVRAAQRVISERVHLTPVIGSETVARRTGAATFHLKCESLQKTGSFKVRGALNA
ncbi:MAG: pyridoxal-phosphate dependent enzyme, partial [Gemmatimonadales bacterium]